METSKYRAVSSRVASTLGSQYISVDWMYWMYLVGGARGKKQGAARQASAAAKELELRVLPSHMALSNSRSSVLNRRVLLLRTSQK